MITAPGEGYPTCTRCSRIKRECRRVETKWRFRHTNPAVRYVDETAKYTQFNPDSHDVNTTSSLSPPTLDSSQSRSRPASASTSEIRPSGYDPIPSLSLPQQNLSLQTHHVPWPLISPRDACLLRYFIEDLSRWFDLTDPLNHFATAIPQRARECSTLLDAILAVSARHFSTLPAHQKTHILTVYGLAEQQIQNLHMTEETVIHYHNKCITELCVLADEPGAVMDQDLLAAVVILRHHLLYLSSPSNPFMNPPTETALQGLHVSLRAQASSALSTPGPRQAAFWIGFRQEFNLAFSQQRTTRLLLSISRSYLSFDEAPDHVWTNRLIVIGTLVLEFCYGEQERNQNQAEGGTSTSSKERYFELVRLKERWAGERPRSFAPVYVEGPGAGAGAGVGGLFPKIWYMDDCHTVAGQALGLLGILLLAYSPLVPRVGVSRREKMDAVDAKIKATVLEICGMALSNRQSRPAGLTACIAINICADRFTDSREQQALMELVVSTMQDSNYWPTTESQAKLRAAWRWDDVD
ncbi:hypothetical protein BDW62DRAFT_209736 [Aspergillus aurantiobrunneus]